MSGEITLGGHKILEHTGVEGAGEVTLQNVTLGDSAVPSRSMNFRNRIINGNMRIDQRNSGSVTSPNKFPVDRFSVLHITDGGAFSAQQDSSVPIDFENSNSLKWTTTTAAASLTSTYHAIIRQRIEGNNVYDLHFGKATAKTITLSFWVKSSLIGTFGGSILNNGQTRCYPFSYTIDTADTWEYKTIIIPGDTDTSVNHWITDTRIGMEVFWSMGVGSDYRGTAGAWTSTPYQYTVANETSVIGTLNATWQITGAQLEKGSVATPFEHRPIGVELSLCQRYYCEVGGSYYGNNWSGYSSSAEIHFPVTMRVTPTCSLVSIDQSGSRFTTGTSGFYQGGYGSKNSVIFWPMAQASGGNDGYFADCTFDAEL